MRQIRTAPTGPRNGIPAIIILRDAQIRLITHRSCVWSIERGVTLRTIGLIIPLGNNGLSALSVNLA